MSEQVINYISNEEKNNILSLFEKYSTMHELYISVSENQMLKEVDKQIITKIETDLENIKKLYTEEWEQLLQKYGVEKKLFSQMFVNPNTNELLLQKS